MSDRDLDPPTHVVCVSDSPGHVVRPEVVTRAPAAPGTPWRLTGVGPHRVRLEHASGATENWWLHDREPFVAHLHTGDPTVWVHEDLDVLRVGERYVAATSREEWTPCLRTLQRRPGRQVAWRVASLQPAEGADDGRPIPQHTATLYHLDPPLRHGGGSAPVPVDWVLVLAYQRHGRGVTAVHRADATGRIVSDELLPGSTIEAADDATALSGIGYEIALPPGREV